MHDTVTKKPSPLVHHGSEHGLSREELKSVKLRNQNMRQIIYKEVKRPGLNHDRLMEMLKNDLNGPASVRREYIKGLTINSILIPFFCKKSLIRLE